MAAPSGATPILGLPYPIPNDDVDVPRDIKALADKLDVTKTLRAASVLANAPVLDVGQLGQARAGRQLTVADFTSMGLSAPFALFNLGDLTNLGSDGRALTNKGAVPFGVGINGQAVTAAAFAGSTAQALYIPDSGVADPFRINTGSLGCWFRTAKRGVGQYLLSKSGVAAGTYGWNLLITGGNVADWVQYDGTSSTGSALGMSDVCDDRWHFAVVTIDGTKCRLYVDGALEMSGTQTGRPFASAGPFNIGNTNADAATAGYANSGHYGRVDETFLTQDVLSDEQQRNLYCASLTHALGIAPTNMYLSVRRKRRGAALAVADFPAQPVRLHNFTAGALTDQGSNNVPLAPGGGGSIVDVAGADGSLNGAKSFSGAHTGLSATDAGLPAGTASRSYGLWVKTTTVTAGVMGWGALTGDALLLLSTTGQLLSNSVADQIIGPIVTDGLWHFAVMTEDNAAADGVKRKMYVDGRMVVGSTVLNSITLSGANRLRIGARADGTLPFTGQLDAAFVFAGAFTGEQVRALYNAGPTLLAASPKAPSDHIETLETARLLATFDSLEASDQIDLGVAA